MTQKWGFKSVIAVNFDSSFSSDIILRFAPFSGSPGSELWFQGSQVVSTLSSITGRMPIKWRRCYGSSDITAIKLFRTEWLSHANAAKVKRWKWVQWWIEHCALNHSSCDSSCFGDVSPGIKIPLFLWRPSINTIVDWIEWNQLTSTPFFHLASAPEGQQGNWKYRQTLTVKDKVYFGQVS